MITDVPAIIFFSFFAALLLNQKFRGRLLARSIFFLPVILSSGVIAGLEAADYMSNLMREQATNATSFLAGPTLTAFLLQMKIPRELLLYVISVVDRIPEIIRASGIQIPIFPRSAVDFVLFYEAARVEGHLRGRRCG